ncbi:MAG TPA: hypothetical protein VJN71_02975 [Nitrososphaerales archaeon]|nr:hypothetical protein [Nitrososphaerales archaeon]
MSKKSESKGGDYVPNVREILRVSAYFTIFLWVIYLLISTSFNDTNLPILALLSALMLAANISDLGVTLKIRSVNRKAKISDKHTKLDLGNREPHLYDSIGVLKNPKTVDEENSKQYKLEMD